MSSKKKIQKKPKEETFEITGPYSIKGIVKQGKIFVTDVRVNPQKCEGHYVDARPKINVAYLFDAPIVEVKWKLKDGDSEFKTEKKKK